MRFRVFGMSETCLGEFEAYAFGMLTQQTIRIAATRDADMRREFCKVLYQERILCIKDNHGRTVYDFDSLSRPAE